MKGLTAASLHACFAKARGSFLAANRENVHTAHTDRNIQAQSVLLANYHKDTDQMPSSCKTCSRCGMNAGRAQTFMRDSILRALALPSLPPCTALSWCRSCSRIQACCIAAPSHSLRR